MDRSNEIVKEWGYKGCLFAFILITLAWVIPMMTIWFIIWLVEK